MSPFWFLVCLLLIFVNRHTKPTHSVNNTTHKQNKKQQQGEMKKSDMQQSVTWYKIYYNISTEMYMIITWKSVT